MRRSRRHAAARSGQPLLLLVAALALAGVVAGLAWSGGRSDASGVRAAVAPPHQAVRAAANSRWEDVLVGLMARRAQAFAEGDPARLGAVYRPGSEVLRRDRAVLRTWARRGLTVERATVRLRAVAVARQTGSSVVLRTIDRLGPAIAVGPSGVTRALPRDRLSAHRIVLARTPAGWRIATIRALSG